MTFTWHRACALLASALVVTVPVVYVQVHYFDSCLLGAWFALELVWGSLCMMEFCVRRKFCKHRLF